ncbi:MAG TPA: hypothetical protein ENG63_04945 [Candidatus Desulfofervidus auxilii]|uniref:Uncharacterized protein n=1 Tax=Desulfofervidus auxilii TaxID=1621989 RepID=A0A7C0Y722_DESA2|nr:hypothetical protein [Candidatus Desulfofervidus auxilii]
MRKEKLLDKLIKALLKQRTNYFDSMKMQDKVNVFKFKDPDGRIAKLLKQGINIKTIKEMCHD